MSNEQKLAEALRECRRCEALGVAPTLEQARKWDAALAAHDSQPRTVLEPLTEQEVIELRAEHGWAKETIRAVERALAAKNGLQLADRGQG